MTVLIGYREYRQPAITGTLRVFPEDALVVNLFGQPRPSGKARRAGTQGNGSDGQASTTLGAAGIDDTAAVLRAHPGTEAVRTLALQVAGLKCSLHRPEILSVARARQARKGRKGYCLTRSNVNSMITQSLARRLWITRPGRYTLHRPALST